MEQAKNRFMQAAIDEALYGIEHGHGGPFGSVIVKDGNIIAKNHNGATGIIQMDYKVALSRIDN